MKKTGMVSDSPAHKMVVQRNRFHSQYRSVYIQTMFWMEMHSCTGGNLTGFVYKIGWTMTQVCQGRCLAVVCLWALRVSGLQTDWALNMLKDVCLSLFYLTIKLYLWGQSWQLSRAGGHFECNKRILTALVVDSMTCWKPVNHVSICGQTLASVYQDFHHSTLSLYSLHSHIVHQRRETMCPNYQRVTVVFEHIKIMSDCGPVWRGRKIEWKTEELRQRPPWIIDVISSSDVAVTCCTCLIDLLIHWRTGNSNLSSSDV